ncbi:3-hydroxyacyl-CoA dehydrogenase family protein [Chloroflexota bacterium]
MSAQHKTNSKEALEVSVKLGDIKHVAVIGAGLMGLPIGMEFARFGYPVSLYNTKEASSKKAMETASKEFDLMVEGQLITAEQAKVAYQRLRPTTNLEDAAEGADYVVESVFDQLALKQEVFAKLDEICSPPTILATNTTALRVTDIASKAKHPERILLTHYFEPPHVIPLVEVGKGEKTDQQVVELVTQLLRKMRKKVVIVPIDVTRGVGGTRLQGGLGTEVRRMFDEWGYTPQMIDDIMTFGFGRRLAWTGNFHRQDLIGLDFFYNSAKERGQEVWRPIGERVERGELGMKSGKGWYEWPGDAAEKFNCRYKLGLMWLLKRDMDEGAI